MSITASTLALGKVLKECQKRLVTAESCTGGGLAYWITSVPGSSEWFDRGFVTYSNAAKEEMLDVNPLTIEKYGAVSEECAREMAEGALKQSMVEVSVAITGIAGPDGGSPEKPVGTIWFAWKLASQDTETKMMTFTGSRAEIREQSIQFALEEVRKSMEIKV